MIEIESNRIELFLPKKKKEKKGIIILASYVPLKNCSYGLSVDEILIILDIDA